MSTNESVRYSRDGDQFHYWWAARRCLRLLSPTENLVAVSIEGASPLEDSSGQVVESGEEKIDVAEYYESENATEAKQIKYIQLKHSTQNLDEPWMPSNLEDTIHGFATRLKDLKSRNPTSTFSGRLNFYFISNRPMHQHLCEAVADIGKGAAIRHQTDHNKLEKYTALTGPELKEFCGMLHLEGQHPNYQIQRSSLANELAAYLPDADCDAPVQLKELVTRKALSESVSNPVIRKSDVLRALKTDERSLFPARCLIDGDLNIVPRRQEAKLIQQIVDANTRPVIIHAAGGVGKTVFSTRIRAGLPEGSLCIVYDCFGNGQYRRESTPRHRHKDALVQIANEMAARGLCDPLIPSANADPPAYMRAFLYRLRQAAESLKGQCPHALLCIAIDAADNAEMAAQEFGEQRSFVVGLLRDDMPPEVRLVMLCRTHRQSLLNPPPHALSFELQPFTREETAEHLRHFFPEATENNVIEFHRLSSQNPRIQANALAQKSTLPDMLRKLGPNPTTVEDTISRQLDNAVKELHDRAAQPEREQIKVLCEGLAVLKPLIPIKTLALITSVEEAAIRSFAIDMGRALIVTDASIQFRDEPAETWFRDNFKPKISRLQSFIEKLKAHTLRDPYIASSLPALMLEAGQFDELVALALGSSGLPEDNPIEKRDIELQRLQFALKASLRARCYTDAAKLALKAGGETAGNIRQVMLLKENTDLVSTFEGPNRILEVAARNKLSGKWMGSHHVYEAGILSGHEELRGEALSRLRMADEWLRNWSRLPDEQRQRESISPHDVAEMAMADLNLYGPRRCAMTLRHWKPQAFMFEAGRLLAGRLVDHARYDDLDQLADVAKGNVGLILAILLELRHVHRNPPKEVIDYALRVLFRARIKLKNIRWGERNTTAIEVITALVEARIKYSTSNDDKSMLASLLDKYLPGDSSYELVAHDCLESQFPLLRAYALHAILSGRSLQWTDLIPAGLREISKSDHDKQRKRREIQEYFGTFWPWYQLWVNILLGAVPSNDLAIAIDDTKAISSKSSSSSVNMHNQHMSNVELARIWFGILVEGNGEQPTSIDDFNTWLNALSSPVGLFTLAHFARLAGHRNEMKHLCLDYAARAFRSIQTSSSDAQEKANNCIMIARCVLPVSLADAEYYFDEAIKVISKLGDDVFVRWESTLDLADRAMDLHQRHPDMAYRLARCAEMIYPYFARDKDFEWYGTVSAMVSLCPSSSIAILSRWRDRNFGYASRLLPWVVGCLLNRQEIEPTLALCLVGFRAQWDYGSLLGNALKRYSSKQEKQIAFNMVWYYVRLTEKTPDDWRTVKEIAATHGVSCPEDIDNIIEFYEKVSQKSSSLNHHFPKETQSLDWHKIFSSIGLNSPDDIWMAYKRFKDCPDSYNYQRFFEEACKRVPIGHEVEFINAVSKIVKFNLYHLESLLKCLPECWQKRPPVRSAVGNAVIDYCRRDFLSVTKSRYHNGFPFGRLLQSWSINEGQIVDEVISRFGEMHEFIDAHHLFRLVGLLATTLSKDQALDALSFGLGLLDGLAERNEGDGPWLPALYPPDTSDKAMAGYIWAGLAAPSASLRWEATHVVRCLCVLGQKDVLAYLIELAKRGSGESFVDARLCFYQKHALQWLVLALARAAKENPSVIAPHADFLLHLALRSQPHVLIREYAAKALIALVAAGQLELEQHVVDELRSVNSSKRSMIESDQFDRPGGDGWNMEHTSNSHRFKFGYEIMRYWFQPLGRCFAIGADEIEMNAEAIILNDWGFSRDGLWEEDARSSYGVYPDRGVFYTHGVYPQTDNLHFYLSYHALMTTAGKLLDANQLHQDPNELENEFQAWLSMHHLAHDDGSWLSDHRDPTPLEWPSWKDEPRVANWSCSVVKRDFERVLESPNGRFNLWGQWTSILGDRAEEITIRSALASSNRAESLLQALQTSSHPDNCQLPFAEDTTEIDSAGFVLKGWIAHEYSENEPTRLDAWAGKISFPLIKPARFVLKTMNLCNDSGHHVWSISHGRLKEEVLWSQLWDNNQDHRTHENKRGEGGCRLQASPHFVREFLRTMDMSFIIKVQIRRTFDGLAHSERYEEDELGYIGPYTRFFAIKPDGRIIAL